MYKPDFFRLEELLPQDFFELNKSRGDLLWLIFDDRVLITLDRLHRRYDRAMTVNDWLWNRNNPFNYRGYRPPDCVVGAMLSQHRYGRAIDTDIKGVSAHEVRKDIRNNENDPDFEYITRIEDDVNWLHFDVGNWIKEKLGILFFKP